jgi:hypothetical protein
MDKDVFMVKQANTRPLIASMMLPLLFLVGCNGDHEASPSTSSATATGETTSPAPSPGAPSTTAISPDEAEAANAWRTLWNAATRRPGTEDAARRAAEPAMVDRLFALTREPREITSSPTIDSRDGNRVSITDCAFIAPSLSTSATVGFVGSVVKREDGSWQVVDLAPRNGQFQPCVPRTINDAAVAAYEDYWSRRTEYFDPPNPDSPLLAQTSTDPQRTFNRDLLAGYRDRGAALRGRPQTHPEIIDVRSPQEVVVLDCQLQDPARGLYDIKSGERLPDIPPMKVGQRDLRSTVLKFEEGRWKAADVQGNTEAACDYAPTTKGLPLL